MNPKAFALVTRKPRRVSVTVCDSTYRNLLEMSDEQGRSISNLAAFLVERGLEEYRREALEQRSA